MKKDNGYLSESDFFAMRRQRNISLWFNVALILLLALLIFSLTSVAKWARPEPFLLKKDDVTGQIDVYQPYQHETSTLAEDDLYKQALVASYVKKREEYYWYDFEDSQKYINTFTEGTALESYKRQIDPARDGTLPNLLKNKGFAKVKVNNVQRLETDLYQVRWTVSIASNGVITDQKPMTFVSLVKFRIGETHNVLSKRLLNPFGVYIYEYRTDQST